MKGSPHPQMVWTQPFKIALSGGRWSESCFPRLRCAPSQRAVRSAAQSSAFHCRRSTQKWVSVAVSALDKFNRRASVPISTVTNYQSVLRSWLTFKRTYSAQDESMNCKTCQFVVTAQKEDSDEVLRGFLKRVWLIFSAHFRLDYIFLTCYSKQKNTCKIRCTVQG